MPVTSLCILSPLAPGPSPCTRQPAVYTKKGSQVEVRLSRSVAVVLYGRFSNEDRSQENVHIGKGLAATTDCTA